MSTQTIETPLEVPSSTPDEGALKLQEQVGPHEAARAIDRRPGEHETQHDALLGAAAPGELTEKKDYWGFLEGKDALLYLRLSSVSEPEETPMDIPALMSKLCSFLPRDRQLERRTRKLAWHLAKGRRVIHDWGNVLLSELTPTDGRMSDEEFAALYPDQVKVPGKKGGRPRKYKGRRKGQAERQRRYRARELDVVGDVTKTPSQLVEE
jgi:hypothetical protein